jgi:predicted N-acetyltransferase YhbS
MSPFTVKAVETDAEYIAVRALTSLVFGGRVDMTGILESMDYMQQRPHFRRDQLRIGVLDGEVVAHVAALPYILRYGAATVTFGGVGGVCSHPDHRGKGYVAAVMRDAIPYMQARGDHLSLLVTGWADLYTRFGYHTLWSDGAMMIETAEALKLNSSLKVRAAAPEDVPQMAALFDRVMAQRVTMPRSRAIWDWRMADESDKHRRVVEDSSGQIAGFLIGFYQNHQIELIAESDHAIAALLHDSARIFQDGGPEKLAILVTPDEPLLHRIRRMVACEFNMECVPGANWMARIIDGDGFRAAVLPEMLRQAGMDAGGLIFDIQPEVVFLGLRGQDSTHAQLDHGAFLQVLFGMLPPAVLPIQPDAAQLLERIFPRRDFIIAPWDWF